MAYRPHHKELCKELARELGMELYPARLGTVFVIKIAKKSEDGDRLTYNSVPHMDHVTTLNSWAAVWHTLNGMSLAADFVF